MGKKDMNRHFARREINQGVKAVIPSRDNGVDEDEGTSRAEGRNLSSPLATGLEDWMAGWEHGRGEVLCIVGATGWF